jgi:glycosyltransferase involved in cell wall biosynthesis
MISLSLIIPCYNESESLPLLLERCNEVIASRSNIEIVIVDNGSNDNTSNLMSKLIRDYSFVTLVTVDINQGYGHGILEGLKAASGVILGWTHADLQTDPEDAIQALDFFGKAKNPEQLFVKGRRYGRPIIDAIFTIGMSLFETLLMRTKMWDINAQPTMFHRSFYESWKTPPKDFSLDLFVYFMAKRRNLIIKRFPVLFGERAHGISHWNVSFSAKFRFIKRTLHYSFLLNKRFKDNA